MRIIDAHTHLGPYHLNGWHQKYDQTGTETVVRNYIRIGIDCIVTSPHPMIQERMEEANAIAAQAVMDYPGKVYGYITIVPGCGMQAVRKEIETYIDHPGFVGFKFLTGYHGELLQPEYEYAMDVADERSCPVLCHEWGDIPKRSGFEQALKTRHRMKLMIAHQGGGSEADTRSCAHIIKDYENAYMELCGSLENRLPVEVIAELCGVHKLIFGTDQINLDPKYELGRVMFAELSDESKEKIFALNFLGLLDDSGMGKIHGEIHYGIQDNATDNR